MRTAVLRREVDRGKASAAVAPVVRGVSVRPDVGEFMKPSAAIGKGLVDFGEGLRRYAVAEEGVARKTEAVLTENEIWREMSDAAPASQRYRYRMMVQPVPAW